jgi:type VI secretion system protein ImpK
MRDELANLIHPVLLQGLRLKERIDRGDLLNLTSEQTTLKTLLLSEGEARRYPDFGGDDTAYAGLMRGQVNPDHFLGVRYGLACWLDELFIRDSPWSKVWGDARLEQALYGLNERDSRFWQQARLAEHRPSADALEGFYLCVMLGFRGELRELHDRLYAWAEAAGKRIAREQNKEWTMPPELEPPINAPPLHGWERLRRMVLVLFWFIFILVPLAAVFLASYFALP